MAKLSTIEKLLKERHGNLHDVIPRMVSEHGQLNTSQQLNVSQNWISRWLAKNGYVKHVAWVRNAS